MSIVKLNTPKINIFVKGNDNMQWSRECVDMSAGEMEEIPFFSKSIKKNWAFVKIKLINLSLPNWSALFKPVSHKGTKKLIQ